MVGEKLIKDRIEEIISSLTMRIVKVKNRKVPDAYQPTIICLPFVPTNEVTFEIIQKQKIDQRKRVRHWNRINTTHEMQNLYAWELISLVVDSLEIKQLKNKTGRPSADIKDLLKYAILKVWMKGTFRKQHSFNLLYKNAGFTKKVLKRTSIDRVFNEGLFTPYVEKIYKNLANFMIPFENSFAVDSSGFSDRYNSRWVQVKLDFQKHHCFKKLHIICGINTQIITSCKITGANEADTLFLKELVDDTAKRFNMRRVCADAGYISRENVQHIANQKAEPFIFPKKGVSMQSKVIQHGTKCYGAFIKNQNYGRETTLLESMWNLHFL